MEQNIDIWWHTAAREIRESGLMSVHQCTQTRKRGRLDIGKPPAVLTIDLTEMKECLKGCVGRTFQTERRVQQRSWGEGMTCKSDKQQGGYCGWNQESEKHSGRRWGQRSRGARSRRRAGILKALDFTPRKTENFWKMLSKEVTCFSF